MPIRETKSQQIKFSYSIWLDLSLHLPLLVIGLLSFVNSQFYSGEMERIYSSEQNYSPGEFWLDQSLHLPLYVGGQLTFCKQLTIHCLTLRTTLTSARIHRARNLCVFSHVQKGTPGLTHRGCVLQCVSLGALSDITVVLGMRQSIYSSDMGKGLYSFDLRKRFFVLRLGVVQTCL